MVRHVALFGDSIFDNGAYTQGEPDVATHLRSLLPGVPVTLCAVDGSTTGDVASQFARMPEGATHAVLSLGGNDALWNADLLDSRVSSTAEALDLFRERIDAFESSYAVALDALLALGRETTACTIYDGNLQDGTQSRARVALALFNDAIVRTNLRRGVSVIELRLVCSSPEHYANPIEPSSAGGLAIARAIARAIGAEPPPTSRIILSA